MVKRYGDELAEISSVFAAEDFLYRCFNFGVTWLSYQN